MFSGRRFFNPFTAARQRTLRRFFLNKRSILSGNPALTGSEARHIRNVLRLRPGDRIAVFDGEGTEYECTIVNSSPSCVTLSVLNSTQITRESPVNLTIAQALLKGSNKTDWIIQKLSELGITAYIPFRAHRSIPKPDINRAESRRRRWAKIAQESLKQCGRSVAPEIKPFSSFNEMIRSKEQYDIKIILCPEHSERSLKEFISGMPKARKIIGVVGPEGGFTPAEINYARECGYMPVSLGSRILRGETATVVVAAILQYAYGDLG